MRARFRNIGAAAFIFVVLLLLAGSEANQMVVPAALPLTYTYAGELSSAPEETGLEREFRLIYEGLIGATPYEAVRAYLELHYLSYLYMAPLNMAPVLDLNFFNMRSLEAWQANLAQRRRLIEEMNLAFVQRERFPYEVRFLEPEEVTDGRLYFWYGWDFRDGAEVMLHFEVIGEDGVGYPPLMAVGGQQTFRMRRDGDRWQITFIYFPGAVRKFYLSSPPGFLSDDAARVILLNEFGEANLFPDDEIKIIPATSRIYNPYLAAEYALRFATRPNDEFYHIGDWMGNCMNFVSQCILHGFGDGRIPIPLPDAFDFMTSSWFGGAGGGIYAWESVNAFWSFATNPGSPMTGRILEGAANLSVGDVVQTRALYLGEEDDPDDFSHALIVVDSKTLLLAQNSPGNFVYYSDLAGVAFRYFRPMGLEN